MTDDFRGNSPLTHQEMIDRMNGGGWYMILVTATLVLCTAVAIGVIMRVALTLI